VPPSLLPPPTTGFGAPPPGYAPAARLRVAVRLRTAAGLSRDDAAESRLRGLPAPRLTVPQGLFGTNQPAASPLAGAGALKTLQHIRLSECYPGRGQQHSRMPLQINDIFLTTTIALPNFFWTQQPWFISPGFGLHLWSGPSMASPAHDLPPNAYSAFLGPGLAIGSQSSFGAELGGRIGVFPTSTPLTARAWRPSGSRWRDSADAHDSGKSGRGLSEPGGDQTLAGRRNPLDTESPDPLDISSRSPNCLHI